MSRFACLLAIAALLQAGCATTAQLTPSEAVDASQDRAVSNHDSAAQQPAQASPQQAAVAETPAQASLEPEASRGVVLETVEPESPPRASSLLSAEALCIYRTTEEQQAPPTNDELAVIASAKTLLGKAPNAKVVVNGRPFTLDCIGTVSAIYYGMSLDVTKDFDIYAGNGVNRLYMTLKERNAIHADKLPRPGDAIIWDNTWDVGGDGDRVHDPRTHAGIVLAVDDDGTIHYVHENLYKGVMIETMNLLRPTVASDEKGKLINSGLAIASKQGGPRPDHTLSGDVFDCFGDVLGLKDYFSVDLAQIKANVPAAPVTVALNGGE